jgi:phosphotransacetylase
MIDLTHVMGVALLRVSLLSAVATINPALWSMLDAAAPRTTADRGQASGGMLEAPPAFDTTISPDAVQKEAIASQVTSAAAT